MTLNATAQVPPPASTPPVNLTVISPALPVTVPEQVLVTLGVGETTRPDGNVSLNANCVRVLA